MPPGPLMVVDREREEREQARQTLERLRKKSPFARGRQAERERAEAAMKGRRPAPPPAEPSPVTPPPKPPVAPPAPSRATGSATGSVTGSVTPPKTPRQLLVDAGWTAENSQLFTGPNDESIEYDDGSRGRAKGWYYIDASGNRTAYGSAKEAIESVLGQPKTAPPRPAAPTQPEQPKTTKKGQANAPKAETAPPVAETAPPKPGRPKKTAEPTPAPKPPRAKKEAKPTPAPVETAPAPAPTPEAAPKATKEQAPPMSPEDIERLVVKGMIQLDTAASNGALVSLTDLRDLLKDKFPTKADFDNAILTLVEQNENVALHRYYYGYGLGPESRTEQDKMVTDKRGNIFIGIALRDTYKPPRQVTRTGQPIDPNLTNTIGVFEGLLPGRNPMKLEPGYAYRTVSAREVDSIAREGFMITDPALIGQRKRARAQTTKKMFSKFNPDRPNSGYTTDSIILRVPESKVPVNVTGQAVAEQDVEVLTYDGEKWVAQTPAEFVRSQQAPPPAAPSAPSAPSRPTPPAPAAEPTPAPAKPAPAPEAAPKATKTGKATTAQPVSAEDKAMLEDIDKNGKKTKQRKRIETEYGEKGKKAIFVENNINEILKEAEESGKVTKQCP